MLPTVFPESANSMPLFSGMTGKDKDELIKGGRLRQCPRGQMLFSHGEPVTHFYVVIKGTFQLFRTNAEGHEKTIMILKSGMTMCESEILDSCRNHRVNAVPVEDSTVLEFPVAWLK